MYLHKNIKRPFAIDIHDAHRLYFTVTVKIRFYFTVIVKKY